MSTMLANSRVKPSTASGIGHRIDWSMVEPVVRSASAVIGFPLTVVQVGLLKR